MSGISTHVLDISLGRPAAGVKVTLELSDNDGWTELSTRTTDSDGRIKQMLPPEMALRPGDYRLSFRTLAYFLARGVQGLYPVVQITFTVTDNASHFHIPLLLTANGYSTYRGS
jgi:5-hydroxyisourate hydrolase